MADSKRYSAIFIAAYLLTSLLNYAFGVALSWYLSPDQFGVLAVAQSFLFLLALAAGSGFAWTTTHDLALNGLTDETRRRFRAGLLANLALGIALGGGLWLAYASGLLPLGETYQNVIPLVALVTVLLSARAVINGAARGLFLFNPVALNLVAEVVIKSLAGIVLVAIGAGAEGVMAAFAVGALFSLFHSLFTIRKASLWRGQGWSDARIVRDTAALFIGMVGTALILNLDVLGLKLLTPPAASDTLAGTYQAAVILARTPVYIAQALTLVTFAYAAKSNALPNNTNDEELIKEAGRAWHRLLLPGALVLILAPEAVLSVFFPAYYLAAAPALRIAAAGGAILALVTLLNGIIQAGTGKKAAAWSIGAGVVVEILALVWLAPRLGATGAATALFAASVVTLLAILGWIWRYTPTRAAIHHWRLGRQHLKAVAPHLALVAALLLTPYTNRWQALAVLCLAGLLYLAILLATTQPSKLRHRVSAAQVFSGVVRVLLGG